MHCLPVEHVVHLMAAANLGRLLQAMHGPAKAACA